MKKTGKIIAGVLIVLIVVTILIMNFFLNGIVKTAVETGGPKLMGVSTTLEDVDLRVLRGKFRLSNLIVGNPEGFKSDHMFKLGSLTVDIDNTSLFRDTIIIREIVIDAPNITYEIGLTGSNIGKLMDSMQPDSGEQPNEEPPKEEEADAKPAKKVIIESLVIKNGKVNIAAKMLGGHGAAIPLPTIHLTDIGKEEEEGASPATVVANVLHAVATAVIGTVSKSGQLVGDGTKAAAEATLKGVDIVGDLAGKGIGASVDAAGKAGSAVGKGASKVAEGITGLFKKNTAEETAEKATVETEAKIEVEPQAQPEP